MIEYLAVDLVILRPVVGSKLGRANVEGGQLVVFMVWGRGARKSWWCSLAGLVVLAGWNHGARGIDAW